MNTKNPRILIADDDLDDCLFLEEAWRACSREIEVSFVHDGDRLLEYLRERIGDGLPNLIVMDARMPGKDGLEALREIKSEPRLREIPVVVMTGMLHDKIVDLAYELGANTIFQKPDTIDELIRIIRPVHDYWFGAACLPEGGTANLTQ